MAEPEDGGGGLDQGIEDVPQEPPTVLRIKVNGIRGCPEDAGPVTISYNYDLFKWGEEEEETSWAGESEAAPEGGAQQGLVLDGEHEIPTEPAKLGSFLLDLARKPMQFKVGGLSGGSGMFEVPLINLVWLLPRDADYDEDAPRVSQVTGWYKVAPEDPQSEEFPEDVQVYLTISLSKIILDDDEIKDANIIDVSVKSLHQLPSAWLLKEDEDAGDHKYSYTLRYSLPGVDKITEVTVEPGTVVPAYVAPEADPEAKGEADVGKDKPGSDDGEEGEEGEERADVTAPVDASNEPKVEEEWYRLQQTDRAISSIACTKEQRVEFSHTHSQFMLPSACQKLKQSFHDRLLFPIEISRRLKDGSDYAYEKKYHGLAQLDIRDIANEDATFITVRCPVGPHHDFQTPSEEGVEQMAEDDREEEERLHDGSAANPYLLAETYVYVEIRMHVPLNPKPPPPPSPLASVRDIIPKRVAVPKHTPEHSGVDEFKKDIRRVIGELQELFGDKNLALTSAASPEADIEARRTQLLCYLSETGKMHEFKVKLKQSVAMMIRDKFKQTGREGMSPAEQSAIVTNLNAALKDEINSLLFAEFPAKRAHGAESDDAQPLAIMMDKEKWLAEEAEINLDYAKAIMHLNRRVVSCPKDAQIWFELGSVVIRSGDIAKAQECFKEAITHDPAHVMALLAYGILMTVRDKFAEAEKYFKESVSAAPGNVLAWSCNVLFYDLESRDLERRTALKQLDTASKKEKPANSKPSKRSPYIRAAELCIDMGSTQMVERAMTQELHRIGDSADLQVMLGRVYLMNRQYDKCRQHLQAALQLDKKCTVAMTLIGHSHYMENNWPDHRADMPLPAHKDACAFYDKAINTKPFNIETLQYVRLAKIQIAIKKWPEAAETLKKAINLEPSATTWLGRAIALYNLGDFESSETALQEAVILDDHNAEVWGASTIVALMQCMSHPGTEKYEPKAEEAKNSLARALKAGISTTETFPQAEFLLEQAGQRFYKIGYYDSAAAAFRRALATVQGPEAIASLNKNLAECCECLNDIPSAIESYKKVGQFAGTMAEWEASLNALIKKTEHSNKAAAKKYQELLKKGVWLQGQPIP